MKENFTLLIEKTKEKELITFLRDLNDEQKKEISPAIKTLSKEYTQFGETKNGRYGYIKGTDKQRQMLIMASFVCFNRSDYERLSFMATSMLEPDTLNKIIDWYCPKWFNDFINNFGRQQFLPYMLTYEWIMELHDRGFLDPGKELVIKTLPQSIFHRNNNNKYVYEPGRLLKRKITLDEHFWYLFTDESNIHSSDRYYNFEKAQNEKVSRWGTVIKKYTDENKIDRARVLQESALASNRNFNKTLSGWFAELFIMLEPTNIELLTLQKELFSVLGSPHSKPVNTSLQFIKKIITEKEFDINAFMDAAPMLLTSGIKTTVASTTGLLEKLAQVHSSLRQQIAVTVSQVFISQDKDLQLRAAKLITKYGDPGDLHLINEIAGYDANLMSATKEILSGFYTTTQKTKEDVSPVPGHDDKIPEIHFPQTIDDVIFLASQAFDNNDPLHIGMLPDALIQFAQRMTDSDAIRFEPALQRALGIKKNGLRSNNGALDSLLASFFIDFGHTLIARFPSIAPQLKDIYEAYDHMNGNQKSSWLVIPTNSSYVQRWEIKGAQFYVPYKQLLTLALNKIKNGSGRQLLSAPTHQHGKLLASVLIERLSACEKAAEKFDDIDLQVAVARCFSDNKRADKEKAEKSLSGEIRHLILFILTGDSPRGPFTHQAAWLTASIFLPVKKRWTEFEAFPDYDTILDKYIYELKHETVDEEYSFEMYDYQKRKKVINTRRRKIIHVHTSPEQPKPKNGILENFFSRFSRKEVAKLPVLYDYVEFKNLYNGVEHNDVKRAFYLVPFNYEPLLGHIINHFLQYGDCTGETEKKLVIAVLEVLHETWSNAGEMSYLFLGTCMLNADKTITNIAGEIWLKNISSIDNKRLGRIIGVNEKIELAPIKRFTDLVMQRLFRVSDQYDQQLICLIENIIIELPDDPIRNLKKLLEIYAELRHEHKDSEINNRLKNKLTGWERSGSLKKVIDLIS